MAASASEGSAAGCKARVGAENAKGGVNGRKIDLEEIDDKSSANLNSAKDLVENRNAFIVINDSAFAFTTYRYLKDAGVPMLGGGFDGSYYYEAGNENIISAYGDGTPVPGLTYDNTTKVMKQLGAKSVGAVGYGVSPSSSESAKAVETYAAKAQGLKSGYLNTAVDFGTTDVAPIVLGIKNAGADGLYLPLDTNTNVAIIQGLQQNNVDMKAVVSATGYGQEHPRPAGGEDAHRRPTSSRRPTSRSSWAARRSRRSSRTSRSTPTSPAFPGSASTRATSRATSPSSGCRPRARTRRARVGSTGSAPRTAGSTTTPASPARRPQLQQGELRQGRQGELRLVRRDQGREVEGPQRRQAGPRQARRRPRPHQAVPEQRRHRGHHDIRGTCFLNIDPSCPRESGDERHSPEPAPCSRFPRCRPGECPLPVHSPVHDCRSACVVLAWRNARLGCVFARRIGSLAAVASDARCREGCRARDPDRCSSGDEQHGRSDRLSILTGR